MVNIVFFLKNEGSQLRILFSQVSTKYNHQLLNMAKLQLTMLCLVIFVFICNTQTPIMTFTKNSNSVILSSMMQFRWLQMYVDPNGGSPTTNFVGTIFDRTAPSNKQVINLSVNGIWTILAGTDQQQTCAMVLQNSTNFIYTYKFDRTAGTASQFANITLNYVSQMSSGETITEFGVGDNCYAIKFNKKVWHYNSSATAYVQDTMPVGATGSVTLDQPYRTAYINGTIYQYNPSTRTYQFQRNDNFYQNTKIINFDDHQERILIFSTEQNATSGRYNYKVSINQYVNGVLIKINQTMGMTSLDTAKFIFDLSLTRIGFGGINSNIIPFIFGSYVNYNQNTATKIQFPPQLLNFRQVPYIYVSQSFIYIRQMVNQSAPSNPVYEGVFKFLGGQVLPISSRNVTPPESLGWRGSMIDQSGSAPVLLDLSANGNVYSLFQVPISLPNNTPNVTNQTDPKLFTFTYPSGVELRQSASQPKWMYMQMDPTGNSGSPLTTFTGQIFAHGQTANKITIVDSQPGNWTILGGTDNTLDCAIVFDPTPQVKIFYYNQTAQTGRVFADVSPYLVAEGVSNPMSTVFDVSNMCQFFSVGSSVYRFNGTNYNNVSVPSGWTGAAYDDTYHVAIFNNSIYRFNMSSNSYVYAYNSTTSPFLANKNIFYNENKLIVYSTAGSSPTFQYKVQAFFRNGTTWNNVQLGLEGASLGSVPRFQYAPDFQSFGLGGIGTDQLPFVKGVCVNYSTLAATNVAIPQEMLYNNQIPYVKLSEHFMYYRRLPSQGNPIIQNHEAFYQIDKANGILKFLNKRNLTAAEQSNWRNTFIHQMSDSMRVLYQTQDGQTISLIQRILGNANGSGSPAANILSSDTGVLTIGSTTYMCIPGCVSCLLASTCDSCADGFVLNSTSSTCMRCKGSCKTCALSDLTVCTDCYPGTYLNSGNCSLCNVNCAQCSILANNCTSCRAGLVQSSGSCVVCTDINCIICSDPATCSICRPGFALDASNACLQCTSACSICDPLNVFTCLSCRRGFELVNSKCSACPSNCDSCVSGVCSRCRDKFRLSQSGKCVQQCQFPCMSCSDSNPTSCLSCSGEYVLSGRTCVPNTACNSTATCEKCAMGFVLFSGVCYPCQTGNNCRQCDSQDSTVCVSCRMGFYLSSDSICQSCPAQCPSCETSQTCTSCIDGYTLSGNYSTSQCSACESPCVTCMQSTTNCLSCVNGYRLQGWKCVYKLNIRFYFQLNFIFASFTTTQITGFINSLITLLSLNSSNTITITQAYSGSTFIAGTIAQSSSAQASASLGQLSALSAGSSINGVPVVSSSFASSETQSQSQSNNLGIILGIIIPVVIIVGVIIGYFVYKKKFSVSSQVGEQQVASLDNFQMNGGDMKNMQQAQQMKVRSPKNEQGLKQHQQFTMQEAIE